MVFLSTYLKKICDDGDYSKIESIKTQLTMDEIDAMSEYMEQKRFPIENCDLFDEEELSVMIYVKYVSEYYISHFMTYLKKIR